MKQRLYSTSCNIIENSKKNTPTNTKRFDSNYQNKYPFSISLFEKQQQTELNNYFPYHIFNKVSNSCDNDNDNKVINISNKIKTIDKKIDNDENFLLKIWDDDINEYIHKLKYGHEFFIKFAKMKKGNLSKLNLLNKKKVNENNMINRRFAKNLFKSKSKKTRLNFYDLIINETQKTVSSNSEKKVIRNLGIRGSSKTLSTNIFRNYDSKKLNLLNENISKNKTQENNSRNKSNIKDNIKPSNSISTFRNYNSPRHLIPKKKAYDLSKLKFPYFPEIIDNNKYYRNHKKLKLNNICKD